MQLGDNNLGSIDTNRDGLSVGLVAGDAFNVDDPLAAVDGSDASFGAAVVATGDFDFVTGADGDGVDGVFGGQFLAQGGAHHAAAFAAGSREVSLAALATRRGNVCKVS